MLGLLLKAALISAHLVETAVALAGQRPTALQARRSLTGSGRGQNLLFHGAKENSTLGCIWWCNTDPAEWSTKCHWQWKKCWSCIQCQDPSVPPAPSLPAAGAQGRSETLEQDFNGKHVALAWHGIYQRHSMGEHGGQKQVMACSDFFQVHENVKEYIADPLLQAGAQVTQYVHTYSRYDCPKKDKELLAALRPKRSKFWQVAEHRIVDSYIEVLKMVQEDKHSFDFVVVLRFDVKYRLPITKWDMILDTIGLPFPDMYGKWWACSQVSDLLYTHPVRYVPALRRALDWSGSSSTSGLHNLRAGAQEGDNRTCDHAQYHGSGHFVWQPLVAELGQEAVHIMDRRGMSSNMNFEDSQSFLGIDRSCSQKYFQDCPNANHDWVSNGLWLL